MFAATDAVLRDNCLTMNGQYGFQAAETIQAATRSPVGPTTCGSREQPEIGYNDTCGLSGLLQNEALGLAGYQPVPARYRNPTAGRRGERQPGRLQALGHQRRRDPGQLDPPQLGGGRLGRHEQRQHHLDRKHHHGQRERGDLGGDSYNFSITDNYLARNNLVDGPDNPASRCPRSTSRSPGATRRTGRPRVHHAVVHGVAACPATPTARSSSATRWWTTAAGSSSGGTPTATATTVSTLVHADARGRGRDRSAWPAARRTFPTPPSTAPRTSASVTGSPPPQLLGRVHVGDPERDRLGQPDRLQPPRTSSAAPRRPGPRAAPTASSASTAARTTAPKGPTSRPRSRSSRTTGGPGTSTTVPPPSTPGTRATGNRGRLATVDRPPGRRGPVYLGGRAPVGQLHGALRAGRRRASSGPSARPAVSPGSVGCSPTLLGPAPS